MRTLGDVTEKIETLQPRDTPDAVFRYVDVSSVADLAIEISEVKTVTGSDAPIRARRRIRTGDVLFATIRPTLMRVAIVPDELDQEVCSTAFYVLRPRPGTDAKFIYHYLQSGLFVERMEEIQGGTSYPAVNDKQVRESPIPLPPLAEQKRIVAVLDEAFAAIEEAAGKKQQAQALITDVVDDSLDAWWLEAEATHEAVRLDTVCEKMTVGYVGPMAARYVDEGVPLLRSQNIRPYEITDENLVYIDEGFHREIRKSQLDPGDVAIVRTGYPGTAAVVPDNLGPLNCSDLVIVRPGEALTPGFLASFFNSRIGKARVAGAASGAAQRHFNVGRAKDTHVPLPPVAEQSEMEERFNDLRDWADSASSSYDAQRSALDELRRSLLHRAFTGRLTAGGGS